MFDNKINSSARSVNILAVLVIFLTLVSMCHTSSATNDSVIIVGSGGCPITNCWNCSNGKCSYCYWGYYPKGDAKQCLACSFACKTCKNDKQCTACFSTAILNTTSKTCYCNTTAQYFKVSNTATSCSSCSSIIANCKTCTQTSPGTAVLCSVCNAGFYLVTDKKSCPACSYACISCTTATPCLACKSTFVLVGGVCICNNTASPPLYLKYSAITCLVCSSIFSNCVSCAPSPANSNVTNCTACASGYSLATNAQSCIKCPSYCLACTSTTVCITCFATFTLSSGTCKCDATANFYLSTTLKKCVLCSVLITNCLTCTPNATKTTQILCSACNSGYYTNLTACLPCRTYCKTCTSATVCTTCIPTFSLISSVCQCDATAQMFLAPSATVCQSCSLFVKHCTTCVNASVTTVNCTVCSAGYFIASVSLCSACPSSCTACTGTLSCTACVTGYDLTNGTCICGPSCLACLALAPYCTSCTISGGVTLTACLSCATGYYIAVSNTACSPCPISCTSCLSTTNCLLCADTYSKVGTLCKCDNTTLFYNSLSLSCQSCPSLILNCITCQLSASILTCSNCLSGYAPSATATTCVLCPSTCTACTTGPICTACVTGYSLTGPDCLCGLDCVLCGVINNCIMCTIDNSTSAVTCQACKVGYYPSADQLSCIACTTNCLVCTGSSECTLCAASFTLISGTCSCDNSITFYSSATKSCQFCGTIFPDCIQCASIISVTTCTQCAFGYYSSATQCIVCNAPCATCSDSTVCLSCIPGYDYTAGIFPYCTCGALCLNCTAQLFDCIDCMLDASYVLTDCLACMTGSYLANSTFCDTCPTNCVSCTSPLLCTSCLLPLVLLNNDCVCNSILGYYPNAGTCELCPNIITNCNSCSQLPNTTIICVTCDSTYYPSISQLLCSPCVSPCITCNAVSNCFTCVATFTLMSNFCQCNNTAKMFLDPNNINICKLCQQLFENCVTCGLDFSSQSVCTSCESGYYLDAPTLCTKCTTPCANCTDSVTCTDCLPTYTLTVSSCGCNQTASMFYSAITDNCQLCSLIIPNCQTCILISGTFVRCFLCEPGTYLTNLSQTCSPCSSSCTECSSFSTCTVCPIGYTLSIGQCICGPSCALCQSLSNNCTSCTIVNSTISDCLSCMPSFYIDPITPWICDSCLPQCLSCTAQYVCSICASNYTLVGSLCLCDNLHGLFANATGNCLPCQDLITHCVTCLLTSSNLLTCVTCSIGYYSTNKLQCITCPLNCTTCTSATKCSACIVSLTPVNGVCLCQGACATCALIDPSCIQCALGYCTTCLPGFYLDTTTNMTCLQCSSPLCLTCTSLLSCTSCLPTFIISSGICVCDNFIGLFYVATNHSCVACFKLIPQCLTCSNISASFQCQTCNSSFYIYNLVHCLQCPNGCLSCTSPLHCSSCVQPSYVYDSVTDTCICNSNFNYVYNQTTQSCQPCTLNYCSRCTSITLCAECNDGAYFNTTNNECALIVCGDGVVSPPQEQCDSGNPNGTEGCSSSCKTKPYYVCNGQPSICAFMSNFTIKFTHSTVTSSTCNNLCLHLSVNPVTPLTSSYNYSAIVSLNDSRLANPSTIYSEGLLVYCYDYTETVQDVSIEITLNCTLLDSDTSKFPIMVMDTLILPNNNILALYYPPETCQTKDTMNSVTIAVTGATYGVLLISALPCKIIGLELIGVLQLAYLSLANMDNLNTMLQPLMYLKTTNGLNMPIVTSSSSVIPERVASISYEANFINNCNIMFAVVAVVIVAALFLYLLTFALKSYAPMLSEIAQRILKEVLLTLLLFNAFNFSYAAGIHFNYASHEDPLYIPSSCLAAAAVALPIIMALMLMVAEQKGFGEFKDKLRSGFAERSYFVVTIIYGVSLGYLMASMNEAQLSTLAVLGLSLLFLVYNLVNLPFQQAYHNYRANLCHFTQFIVLFIAMYYRSMRSTSSPQDVAQIFAPAFIEISSIATCIVVSTGVLAYEIYQFIVQKFMEKTAGAKILNENTQGEGQMQAPQNKGQSIIFQEYE